MSKLNKNKLISNKVDSAKADGDKFRKLSYELSSKPLGYKVKQSPNIAYIYALVDPRYNTIRYIGKSVDPRERWKTHIEESLYKQNTNKTKWINELLMAGFTPTLKDIEFCQIDKWKQREKFWIKKFKAEGCKLTNMTDGGDQSW